METRYLRSFLKIAETGSITRAAESLGIAQPSLSQQLLRLEDEIGVSLFSRTARGVTLTDSGRLFQEHARQLLRVVDTAVEDIRHLDDDPVGDVILAVPYSISRIAGVVWPPAKRFSARCSAATRRWNWQRNFSAIAAPRGTGSRSSRPAESFSAASVACSTAAAPARCVNEAGTQ